MTSQISSINDQSNLSPAGDCRPPENVPADYCRKLKAGITRLRTAIQAQYEEAFPAERESIERAVREAEKAAWATPFPSLFFPALAHLRVQEDMPSA